MITLTFENRSQIVVNLQKPLHEVWLAARSGGYHFKYDGTQWMDTKGHGEFFAVLSRDASAQAAVHWISRHDQFLNRSRMRFRSSVGGISWVSAPPGEAPTVPFSSSPRLRMLSPERTIRQQ